MKPAYEHVEFGEDCSVRVYHRRLPRIPFEWHHHPEYELTLTMNSRGKRYIGDSVDDYEAEDLVLVPPDLPHTWASNRSIEPSSPQVAIVIWFDGDWARRMADCCREYEPLRRLLRRAACGLAFDPPAGEWMRGRLDRLLSSAARERLSAALDILCALADAPGQPLASPSAFNQATTGPSGHEPERINRVLSIIDARFAEQLRLSELCAAASLSERTLTRYFVQHIGESVGRYIARVRIGHACRMLADTSLPVAVIAARSGFANVANFNRQFKAARRTTPAEYRRQFATAAPGGRDDAAILTERSPSLESERKSVGKRKRRSER
ncbi:helix-turn-helix domain-containing protein [Caballeronia sp. LZ062]|uniref:helix-turn-helix domain-containing protein n=1 Tax=unclassified Caballeronia TaxID=2646786 RepID=UPI002857F34B|nr:MULTISPECIES: helix-turn-helix domain-containing protein [unclassified Caballeronia]MDR5856047.1 helix-turn-helix domain-containing protein [Caballeronia sp. LZ050]MDR5872718.1 helix-turn-helix domain-containing protein [Caballeronia sp. LZ062]